ncbi:Pre-mRNA-processing factor 39 [Vitis vinifera]|uniref:Pre-mRNA-processing factor 39 n=1 Tax=Vitis vinifera TaxID=29760 RepID=A0A438JPE7_VITVI|nr:Pre-mRNA-processing factor 39 [Vitis vinifera]
MTHGFENYSFKTFTATKYLTVLSKTCAFLASQVVTGIASIFRNNLEAFHGVVNTTLWYVLALRSKYTIESPCHSTFCLHSFPVANAKPSMGFGSSLSLSTIVKAFLKEGRDDIKKICLVYDSFLSEFPLCYGYWRKYADHKSRLCTVDKVIEVYERAVQSATYSVGLWVDYCSFSMSVFEDPFDVRR